MPQVRTIAHFHLYVFHVLSQEQSSPSGDELDPPMNIVELSVSESQPIQRWVNGGLARTPESECSNQDHRHCGFVLNAEFYLKALK